MKKKYNCPCCGHPTYPVPPKDDVGYICDICWWENDPFIQSDDEPSDQNHGMTLKQAKENYKKYGISAPHLLEVWRKWQETPETAEQIAGTLKRNLLGTMVEIDLKATKEWYSRGNEWDCECAHCRNFLELARRKQFPQQVLDLLDGFGIRPEQATYVCQLYDDAEGQHYQFSYRLAGNLVEEADEAIASAENIGRCCHEPYPYGAPDFPEPHFDLEFYLTLPWVLDESDK